MSRQIYRRKENHKIVFDYLNGKSCIDCGESDVMKLSFDHVFGKKEKEISSMIVHMGLKDMKNGGLNEELRKCVIRCVNCHQKRTTLSRMSSKTIAYVEYFNI